MENKQLNKPSRLSQLDALADAVPGLNQQAAKRAKAANQIAFQQQVAQAPRQTNVTRAAQQLAPKQALKAGQVDLAAQQQQQQLLGGIGQQALQTKTAQDNVRLGRREIAQTEDLASRERLQNQKLIQEQIASRKQITQREIASQASLQRLGIQQNNRLQFATLKQREELSSLGNDLKDKLVDARLRFERDELGTKFSDMRQLADWTVANTKTEQEFQEKFQAMQQASQYKISLLEISNQGIIDTLERGYRDNKQRLDFETKKRLVQMQKEMAELIAREKACPHHNGK